MKLRTRVVCVFLGASCAAVPLRTIAKDKPPAFRVASIELKQGGHLDAGLLAECDVTKIVTSAVQHERAGKRASLELALRIDSVVKLRGSPPPGPRVGGTELGLTLLSAGGEKLDQPFLCRKQGFASPSVAAHCSRIAKCSATMAEQMSMWLSAR